MTVSDLTPLMAMAQTALYAEPNRHAHYLECTWPVEQPVLGMIEALKQALQPCAGVHIALAFSLTTWQRLNANWQPASLREFVTLQGTNGATMPSTQADVWFWLHGDDRGDVMAGVLQVHHAIRDVLRTQREVSGFKNREARDLTGFVDGTANPKLDKRGDAAQIPCGQEGAGGSYVLTQQWRHRLSAFQQLTDDEQAQVIGRTKQDNIELTGDAMPPTSHVSRTDVNVDGVAQKIWRRSTPYGGAEDHGLYFIGFACELNRLDIQLQRMLGNTDDGYRDHLMQYSQAISGAYWFMPAQVDLNAILSQSFV